MSCSDCHSGGSCLTFFIALVCSSSLDISILLTQGNAIPSLPCSGLFARKAERGVHLEQNEILSSIVGQSLNINFA